MCDVNTILGFKTLVNEEFLDKAGIEICPSPSSKPAK
jgi:hypothetical protein